MKKQGFVYGAVVLTAAGFLVKIIGFVYKIPLTNIFGEEAMGYYNSALQIYTTMYVLATAGLPVTVSRMIACSNALKRFTEPRRILRISMLIYCSVSILIAVIMLIFTKQIAGLIRNDNAASALICVAPAVFFVSAVAALRGYFQGYNNMLPTAVSNIIEAIIDMGAGFGLAFLFYKKLYPNSPQAAAAGAAAGISVAAAAAFVFMLYIYLRSRRRRRIPPDTLKPRSYSEISMEFLKTSIPILIGSLTMNLTNTIDVFVLINRLVYSGVNQDSANFIYGSYTSMAVLLYNMPATIAISLCTSALPTVAAAFAVNDSSRIRRSVNTVFRMNAIVAFPCALGLSVMAKPILSLLFHSRPDGVAVAAPLLGILAIAIIPMTFSTVSTSVLQAVKKTHIPVINVFAAGTIKFILNFILIAIPAIGITGAPIATTVSYTIILVLNVIFIKKYTGIIPDLISCLIKPLISAAGCAAGGYAAYRLLTVVIPASVSTVVAIIVSAIIYIALMILLKGITANDINLVMKNKKIKKTLEK